METQEQNEKSNKPTHRATVRHGVGKKATYEQIGVGWFNEDNASLYVKLTGKQIVEDGFTLYPIESDGA